MSVNIVVNIDAKNISDDSTTLSFRRVEDPNQNIIQLTFSDDSNISYQFTLEDFKEASRKLDLTFMSI